MGQGCRGRVVVGDRDSRTQGSLRLGQAGVWVSDRGNGKFLTGVLMQHKHLWSGRWGPQGMGVPRVQGNVGRGKQWGQRMGETCR